MQNDFNLYHSFNVEPKACDVKAIHTIPNDLQMILFPHLPEFKWAFGQKLCHVF